MKKIPFIVKVALLFLAFVSLTMVSFGQTRVFQNVKVNNKLIVNTANFVTTDSTFALTDFDNRNYLFGNFNQNLLSMGNENYTMNFDSAGIKIYPNDSTKASIRVFNYIQFEKLPTDSSGLPKDGVWRDANGFIRLKRQ